MKMLFSFVMLFVFCAGCVSGCSPGSSGGFTNPNTSYNSSNYQTQSEVQTSSNSIGNNFGNTSGNIANGGFAVLYGDYIYFVNRSGLGADDDYMLYRLNQKTKEKTRIGEDSIKSLNIINGWIYYSSYLGTGIYKMDIDGKDKQKISNDDSDHILLFSDWIFFTNKTEGGWPHNNALYKMGTDGTNRLKLSDGICNNINIDGEYLYFSETKFNDSDDFIGLYSWKMRLDGTEKMQILSLNQQILFIRNGFVYYRDISANDNIFRYSLSDGISQRIIGDSSHSWNIFGEYIYYCNREDKDSIYKVKIDGTDIVKLNDDISSGLNMADNIIFYTSPFEDVYTLKAIMTNGIYYTGW